jgi:hypothetical protein
MNRILVFQYFVINKSSLILCEIWGFHGGEDDDVLGFGTM